MSKQRDEDELDELDDQQLEEVVGGRGIFETIGPAFGLSAGAGKALDISSTLTAAPFGWAGYAYGLAQAGFNAIDTTVQYANGTASGPQVTAALVNLGISAIPGGVYTTAIGIESKGAEYGIGQIVAATTTGAEAIVDKATAPDHPAGDPQPATDPAHADDPAHVDDPAHPDDPEANAGNDTSHDPVTVPADNSNGDFGPVDPDHPTGGDYGTNSGTAAHDGGDGSGHDAPVQAQDDNHDDGGGGGSGSHDDNGMQTVPVDNSNGDFEGSGGSNSGGGSAPEYDNSYGDFDSGGGGGDDGGGDV